MLLKSLCTGSINPAVPYVLAVVIVTLGLYFALGLRRFVLLVLESAAARRRHPRGFGGVHPRTQTDRVHDW